MESEDKKFKDLMSYSKLDLPFSDFDSRMLQRIQEYESKKRKADRTKFFARLSFLMGTIFGLLLNYFLSKKLSSIFVSSQEQEYLILLVQLVYVLLIVLFADKLLKLFNMNYKELFK